MESSESSAIPVARIPGRGKGPAPITKQRGRMHAYAMRCDGTSTQQLHRRAPASRSSSLATAIMARIICGAPE